MCCCALSPNKRVHGRLSRVTNQLEWQHRSQEFFFCIIILPINKSYTYMGRNLAWKGNGECQGEDPSMRHESNGSRSGCGTRRINRKGKLGEYASMRISSGDLVFNAKLFMHPPSVIIIHVIGLDLLLPQTWHVFDIMSRGLARYLKVCGQWGICITNWPGTFD